MVSIPFGAIFGQDDSTTSKENSESREKDEGSDSGWILEGFTRLRYRLRYTREYADSTEEDQDVAGVLSLCAKDKEEKPKYSLHLLAGLNMDIDGRPAGGTGPYRDVYSEMGANLDAKLYSGYLEASLSKARFYMGRQSLYRGESLDFDGLRTEYRPCGNMNLSLYGGIPSNIWESSHEGDHFAGGGVEVGVPKLYSLRTDFIHIRDKKTYEPGDPAVRDNLLIISAKYTRFKPLKIEYLYSSVNGDERRSLLRARFVDKKLRLLVKTSVLRQGVEITELSTEMSPYSFVLAEYAPYYRYRLMGIKGLGSHLELEAGLDIRELLDEADEGMLNRSYEKYYAGVHLRRLLDEKVEVSMVGEKWNALTGDDINAFKGLVKVRLSDDLKVRAGSEYAMYKYDYNFMEERENVYSYFARADYEFSEGRSLRFKYSFNRDDREDYNFFELFLIVKW